MISALIGIGLMAIIVLGVMGGISHLALAVKTSVRNNDIDTVMDHIIAAIGTEESHCTAILKGQPYVPTSNVGTLIDTEIAFQDNSRHILQAGSELSRNGVLVKEVRLQPVTQISTNTGLAELIIVFDRQDVMGGRAVQRQFPLYVGFDNGELVFCSASVFSSHTIKQRVCANKGLGYSVYDPVADRSNAPDAADPCQDTSTVMWVQGESGEEAKCPPRFKLAAPNRYYYLQDVIVMNHRDLCYTSDLLSGDPPPRYYTNSMGVKWKSDSLRSVRNVSVDFEENACRWTLSLEQEANANQINTAVRCVPEG